MRPRRLPIAAALLAFCSIALAACTPPATTAPTASPTDSDPSASASASPDPDAIGDGFLFRITTTVRVPSGATAELVETVSAPRSPTAAELAELTDNYCPMENFTPPAVQDVRLEATVTSGTWPMDPSQILVSAGAWSVFAGDVTTYQAYCSPLLLTVPGSASALPIFVDGPPDAVGGWAAQQYGFSVDTSWKATGAEPGPNFPVIIECGIALAPEAMAASAIAASWATEVQAASAETCVFGELS